MIESEQTVIEFRVGQRVLVNEGQLFNARGKVDSITLNFLYVTLDDRPHASNIAVRPNHVQAIDTHD